MGNQIKNNKFEIFWIIGTILSALLYYSGLVTLYKFLRIHLFQNNRRIVLTYHRVNDRTEDKDMTVSVKNFEKQMNYIHKHYANKSLYSILQNMKDQKELSTDEIAITFDDGYKDNYTNAFPILKKYELAAFIFLIVNYIGTDSKYLNADEIREMLEFDIDFGSHTNSHPILSQLDSKVAVLEITDSKKRLETILNNSVHFFAYPKGKKEHFNDRLKNQVKNAGYAAAFATLNGELRAKSDLFELPRIGIRNCPLFVFKTRISGIFESKIAFLLRKMLKMI